MSNAPLMPMATAVWLVENTTLTFKQIADFCKLHEVEIQGIADGEVAKGIKAYNPIISGQLSREEIALSSKDENRPLQIKNMDIEIKDPEVWVSQIQGPLSMKLLENIADGFSENNWKYFDWKELQILNQKVIVSRSGFTNELGWEIYFRPENETEKIGDYILEEGKKLGMILVATPGFRCRRIEAGLLSAGQDFTKKTNPFSVGLGRFINFDKEDFIGKEALMTSDKKCKTWGIRVAEGTAIKGESIKINEKNIGKITSSTWSPYQICGVGIVHLDNNENGPGDVVDVKCTDGKVHKGEICKLPMYDAKGEIVRGLNRNIPKVPNPWPGIKTTN